MKENELFLTDVRLQDRFLSEGTLSEAAITQHLEGLADLSEHCEEFELEQPALAKEQVEPPPAPVIQPPAAPAIGAPPSFGVQPPGALDPTPAAPPAIVDPDAPVRPQPDYAAARSEAVPAIAPEPPTPPAPAPAPAPDSNSPASIPPPTASVDADWGDS
jgi:hypothetical protein